MKELLVATKNKKKLKEIKDLLKGMSLKITSLQDYPSAPRIVENGKSFRENAIKKAVMISAYTKSMVMGEDSGLCIDSLGGRPGIYSSRFSGKEKSDSQNNLKVLRLMRNVPKKKRSAHYVCAVALAEKGKLIATAEGTCHGRIAEGLKGDAGFGYDPLFLIVRYNKTFAELGERLKHQMSHRYKALKKAKSLLKKLLKSQ